MTKHKLCTRTKYAHTEDKGITIREYIHINTAFRDCDPQNGSSIRFLTSYRVVIKHADDPYNIEKHILGMEEVFERYPWFFQD